MTNKQVVLQDVRKTYTLELPSFKGSKVELYDGILFGDAQHVEELPNDMEKGIESLILMIKSWNFTDADGNPAKISKDSFYMLPSKDLTFLMEKISQKMQETDEKSKKV
jgi:hypothetical protein